MAEPAQLYRCIDCGLDFGQDYVAYKAHYKRCPDVAARIGRHYA